MVTCRLCFSWTPCSRRILQNPVWFIDLTKFEVLKLVSTAREISNRVVYVQLRQFMPFGCVYDYTYLATPQQERRLDLSYLGCSV